MRIVETTRPPQAARLRHAVCFHRSDADLLARLAPLVRSARERGEPVALALRPATREALLAELGGADDTPAGLVTLAPPEEPDGASGQTVAARRARELRSLAETAGPVTVVVEHWDRFDGADGRFWTELDAATNVALADLPVTQTCFFPDLALHQLVTEGAVANHPLLHEHDEVRDNVGYRPPREVLADTPAPAPVLLGPPDVRRRFGAWALNEVRALVEQELVAAGFGGDRAEDVVLAVNEIATNAVEHGCPEAELALWTSAGGGVVVEVHDSGVLRDPLPGLVAPHPGEPRGRGLWIARQLCDSLHLWADDAGTHVRARAAP